MRSLGYSNFTERRRYYCHQQQHQSHVYRAALCTQTILNFGRFFHEYYAHYERRNNRKFMSVCAR